MFRRFQSRKKVFYLIIMTCCILFFYSILKNIDIIFTSGNVQPRIQQPTHNHKYGNGSESNNGSSELLVTGPLTPHVQILQDVEVYYMIPTTPKVIGLLVFFHGCQHSGQHLFILPEDRLVALAALNRGLVVASPTSLNRVSQCWGTADVDRIGNMLPEFEKHTNISTLQLPRMGMGASSGGAFLFQVYQVAKFKSMVSYVMGHSFSEEEMKSQNLPSTGYVHMPRDTWTAEAVAHHVASLKSLSIPTHQWKVHAHPFTPKKVCLERLVEFKTEYCYAFFERVHQQKLLNQENIVIASYTEGIWNSVMQESRLDDLNLNLKPGYVLPSTKDHSWLWKSVEEEIAVSYAIHEMTAEYRDEVLDFLMKMSQ